MQALPTSDINNGGNKTHRSRISLTRIYVALLHFLKASDGMSARELANEVDIAIPSAQRFIRLFQSVMGPETDKRTKKLLTGHVYVEIVQLPIPPHTHKNDASRRGRTIISNRGPEIMIAVAPGMEKSGRMVLHCDCDPDGFIFGPLVDRIGQLAHEDATIVTRKSPLYPAIHDMERAQDGRLMQAECRAAWDHVLHIIKTKYRKAISSSRLQEYLNEISFRYNFRNNPRAGAGVMMERLLKYSKRPTESQRVFEDMSEWESDLNPFAGMDVLEGWQP